MNQIGKVNNNTKKINANYSENLSISGQTSHSL